MGFLQNKQFIRLMQQRYELIVSKRTQPTYSFLYIGTKDNQHIFRETTYGPPEKAMEELWIMARVPVEKYTNESIFNLLGELEDIRRKNRGKI